MLTRKVKVDMVPIDDGRMICDSPKTRHSVFNPQLKNTKPLLNKELAHDAKALEWDIDAPPEPGPAPKPERLKSRNLESSYEHPLLSTVDQIMAEMEQKGTLHISPEASRKARVKGVTDAHKDSTIDLTFSPEQAEVQSPRKKKLLTSLKQSSSEAWIEHKAHKDIPEQRIAEEERKLSELRANKEKLVTDVMKKKSWIRETFEKFDSNQISSKDFASEVASRGIPLTQDFFSVLKSKDVRFSRVLSAIVKGKPVVQTTFLPQDSKTVKHSNSITVISHTPKSAPSHADSTEETLATNERTSDTNEHRSGAPCSTAAESLGEDFMLTPAGMASSKHRHPLHSHRRHFDRSSEDSDRYAYSTKKKRIPERLDVRQKEPVRPLSADSGRMAQERGAIEPSPELKRKVDNLLRSFVERKVSGDSLLVEMEKSGVSLSDKQRIHVKNSEMNMSRYYRETRMIFKPHFESTTGPEGSLPEQSAGLPSKIGDYSIGDIIKNNGGHEDLIKTVSRRKKKDVPQGLTPKAKGRKKFPNSQFANSFNGSVWRIYSKNDHNSSTKKTGKRILSKSADFHKGHLSPALTELKSPLKRILEAGMETTNERPKTDENPRRPSSASSHRMTPSRTVSSPRDKGTDSSRSFFGPLDASSDTSRPQSPRSDVSSPRTSLGNFDNLKINTSTKPSARSQRYRLSSPFGTDNDTVTRKPQNKDSRLEYYKKLKEGGRIGRYAKEETSVIPKHLL